MPKIEVSYTDYLKETNKMLGHGGLLLASTDAKGNPNAMTIGWGTIGIIWAKPIFVVLVRPSRYTYDLIEITNDFTVNVPHLILPIKYRILALFLVATKISLRRRVLL